MAAAVQRTSSSELPRARTGANRQSPAEDQHLLSSSLSGNTISTADFINKRQTEYCTLPRYRPRSATLQVTNQIRRSLRGLSRSRPATARSGRPNAHSYDELRREASLQKVDNAFARIKEQLAQFSEEDEVLKDRIDKLLAEMTDLSKAHKAKSLQHKRSSSEQPNNPEQIEHERQCEKIAVSTSEGNLAPLNSELYHQPGIEHAVCGTESQSMFIRPSQSGNDLVNVTEAQHMTVAISESESRQTETESLFPSVMIPESENRQIGFQSPIPVLEPALRLSESKHTGTETKLEESPIPTLIVSVSDSIDSDPEEQLLAEGVADFSVPHPSSLVKGVGGSAQSTGHSPRLSDTKDDVFFNH